MRTTEQQLANLALLVSATSDREIDCAELLDRVATYVRAIGQERASAAPCRQVAQHLQVCPECYEELRALLDAEGLDPQSILIP